MVVAQRAHQSTSLLSTGFDAGTAAGFALGKGAMSVGELEDGAVSGWAEAGAGLFVRVVDVVTEAEAGAVVLLVAVAVSGAVAVAASPGLSAAL